MIDKTDKPKKPKHNASRDRLNFIPCSISAADAQLRYLGTHPRPTLRKFAEMLKAEGHKVSTGTINKWAQKHRWCEANEITARRRESDIINILQVMAVEGVQLTPGTISGVQARLYVHLGECLPKVECKTPADVVLLLEACEKLRGLAHTVRGDAFEGVRKTGEAIASGVPTVVLGNFKPKIATGNGAKPNGNGEAHE